MPDQPVVYKTGATLSQIFDSNKSAENQPPVTPETPTIPITPPTPAAVEPTPLVTPDALPPITPEPVKEANVSDFKFEEFDEPAVPSSQPAPAAPTYNLAEILKTADPKEILKELGVTDFAIEINQHIKNGGQAVDYLNAKAIDYNKISDDALLKDSLRKEYPTLSPSQIDLMFNRKYASPEDAPEEDKEFFAAQKQADAYKVRQTAIVEQNRFKIAETVVVPDNSDEQDLAYQQQHEKTINFYKEHPDTQSLMTGKRVAIDLGTDGKFNYNIDKPEMLTRAILDGQFWKRVTSVNPKEPDVAKLIPNVALQQKLAFIAMNPNYEKDLVNYGRSLQLPALVKEGQNIVPPTKVIPMQSEQQGVDWSKAKSGKVGDHKN